MIEGLRERENKSFGSNPFIKKFSIDLDGMLSAFQISWTDELNAHSISSSQYANGRALIGDLEKRGGGWGFGGGGGGGMEGGGEEGGLWVVCGNVLTYFHSKLMQ